MKKLAVVVGAIAAACLLDALSHLLLGVGFLYVPTVQGDVVALVILRGVIGVFLAVGAAAMYDSVEVK
jgi:hypothetical protein